MAMSIGVKHQKKRPRGRPPTGHEYIGLRLQPDLMKKIDSKAKREKTTRSGAIRRMIEKALADD
ncbi:MAG: ribbon-helix-helix protein, CopG family [Rhizobiales bacterium]|nr:ribbon-helix-helix protein, CopG family [Hyphomicrobiales bacterium]